MNTFYRDYSQQIIFILLLAMCALLFIASVVLYQVLHRPLPKFSAVSADGKSMSLAPYDTPALVPGALLKWASKAAVAAYTFDFVNYDKQIGLVRPYFTSGGWSAYQSAILGVVQRVKKNQLIVSSVISGAPVISNQGELIGHGYTWRVQIPFLATYQSSDESRSEKYYVILTIVKVPTTQTPEGIGIDQFEMVRG